MNADRLAELAQKRLQASWSLLPGLVAPVFDEAALRLCVAFHNLLALSHPAWAQTLKARESVIGFSTDLSRLGPPADAAAAVARYSLLARISQLQRNEHEVRHWLGSRTFVGRLPPKRLLMWPKMRRVQVSHQARMWLRDIGIPNDARSLWETMSEANPLLEALDSTRLDPPVSWQRLITVLRFAPLARSVSARLVGQGIDKVGEPLTLALFRHGTLKAGSHPAAGVEAVAFGIQFLSHVYWLHSLARAQGEPGPALSALLTEAAVEPRLVYPPDVMRGHARGLVTAYHNRLVALRQRARNATAFVEDARATVAQAVLALSPGPNRDLAANTV